MFSSNNKLFDALGHLVDLVILNFIFIICSLPLVTVYPAFVALVGTIKGMFEDESTPAWKQFFKLFYYSIKKGAKIWFVLFASSLVLMGDIIAIFFLPPMLQSFLLPFMVIMTVLFFGVFSHLTKLFILGEHRFKTLVNQSFFQFFRKPLKPFLAIVICTIIIFLSMYLRFIPFVITFSLLAFTYYFLMFERNLENLEIKNG